MSGPSGEEISPVESISSVESSKEDNSDGSIISPRVGDALSNRSVTEPIINLPTNDVNTLRTSPRCRLSLSLRGTVSADTLTREPSRGRPTSSRKSFDGDSRSQLHQRSNMFTSLRRRSMDADNQIRIDQSDERCVSPERPDWPTVVSQFNILFNSAPRGHALVDWLTPLLKYPHSTDFWLLVAQRCFTTKVDIKSCARLVRKNLPLLEDGNHTLLKAVRRDLEMLVRYKLCLFQLQDETRVEERLGHYIGREPCMPFRAITPISKYYLPLTDQQADFNRRGQWWLLYQERLPLLANAATQAISDDTLASLINFRIQPLYRASFINCLLDNITSSYRLILEETLISILRVVESWSESINDQYMSEATIIEQFRLAIDRRLQQQALLRLNQPVDNLMSSKSIIAADAHMIYQQYFALNNKTLYREYFYATMVKAPRVTAFIRTQIKISSGETSQLFDNFIQLRDDENISDNTYQRQIKAILNLFTTPRDLQLLYDVLFSRCEKNNYYLCLASRLTVLFLIALQQVLGVKSRQMLRKLTNFFPVDNYWAKHTRCVIKDAKAADRGSVRINQYLNSL